MTSVIDVTMTKDGSIPVIMTGQALLSLRDSGHNLPTALGEAIDNAVEAKANRIDIRLDQSEGRRKRVHRIVIADDGTGMDVITLHKYLVIGFSTRYMRTDTIGKYGVGAKLAALNLGRRIDVWSRQSPEEPWRHVYFDLDEALEQERLGRLVALNAPKETPLTDELSTIAPAGSGTVVVWSHVDRLEEGRMASNFDELRHEAEKDLSRMFRYFITGGIIITINARPLVAHDPLMLMEQTRADEILTRALSGEKRTQVGARHSDHFPARIIADEEIIVDDAKARMIVTLYPKEIIRRRGLGGDDLSKELRVPENKGSISFVRMKREIAYTNVPHIFKRQVEDPDRFIGIEVSFDATFDEYFGVRNVKRGVEPHGGLRKKLRDRLSAHVQTARKLLDEIWGEVAREMREKSGEHSAVLQAIRTVDLMMPKSRAAGSSGQDDLRHELEKLAADAGRSGTESKGAYIAERERLPFVVESVDFPGNMFITTLHVAGTVLIRLNTRHPFYREMWEPLKMMAEAEPGLVSGADAVHAARRTIEALTLLVVAYGKSESMHPNPSDQYGDLLQYWGQFLATMLKNVKDVL
jgi:hypothetical protein